MVLKNFGKTLLIGLALGVVIGCSDKKRDALSSGIHLENFDKRVALGDNFYQFVSGGWLKNNPLRETDMSRDAFAIIEDSVNNRLTRIITNISSDKHSPGSVEQKIADFYNLAMDSIKLNQEGCAPLRPLLDKIEAITTKEQLIPILVELGREVSVYPYFMYGSILDMVEGDKYILGIAQGGLGLPKEYYLSQEEMMIYLRNEYKRYSAELFKLTGLSEKEALQKAEYVMDLETEIAKTSLSQEELRDLQANYHKMTIDELKSTVPDFDWDLFFKEIGLRQTTDIDLRQIEPIKHVARLHHSIPLPKHIAYMQFHLLSNSAPFLSDDYVDVRFDFYGRILSGLEELDSRQKRAIININNLLGELVGKIYVQHYSPAADKERMILLVENLQAALGERIQAQSWMCDSTKIKALEKLDALRIKIGYPDKWKNYSSLKIEKDSYWANACRVKAWDFADDLNKVGTKVDQNEWNIFPQTVNANYNPQENSICFPAAILQPPFFDANADDAFNYGAIGTVIGHEMTHGFDDQGRHFDKNGNMIEWWSEEDIEEFNQRVQGFVDYFNQIEVLPGLYANGVLTLGENIADHGGLEVSFHAFQKAMKKNPLQDKDGFTPKQRFFISYARLWASNMREEFIRYITQNDVHSVNKWRVNATLPHINAWYEAFDITPEDSMYIEPEKRIDIW